MRTTRQRDLTTAILWVTLVLAGACKSGAPAISPISIRDSAGIHIVESSAPVFKPGNGWTISETPFVEIGVNEKDSTQILSDVGAVVRLDDGRIVVVNAAAPAVRWYDSTGVFLQGAGRFGQGPGEFDSGEGGIWIDQLWALPGDSIGTWEHSRRRMQVFDSLGKFARAVVLDLPPNMPPAAYPQTAGRIGDGFLVFLTDERSESAPLGVVTQDSATFIRYTVDGKFSKELARLPSFVHYMSEVKVSGSSKPFRAALRPPFAAVFSVWPHRDRMYYGDAERYEIVAYDSRGTVRTLIRRPGPRRPVTAELIRQYKETRLATAGDDPAKRRAAEDQLKDLPFPDSLPAYRRFRVDRDGSLWVQEYSLPGATSALWSVFDKEGRWLTDVSIPMKWQIADIGRDYIITIETNELDVERVRMYKLTRGK